MSTPEPGPPAWPGAYAPLPPYAAAPLPPSGSAPPPPAVAPLPPYAGPPAAPPLTPVTPLAPYGAAPPPGWAPRPTDGLAIAAFVVACCGLLLPATGPVALGLGIGAQRRVRRTGAPGRGLAVAATWIGGAFAALMVAAVVVAVTVSAASTGASGASAGAAPATGPAGGETALPWFALTDALVPGDCLATAPETYDMSDAGVVDCGTGHATEVLDRLTMAEPVRADVTTPDAAYTALLDRCAAVVESLVDPAALPADSWADVYFVHPDQWAAGDRWAYCVLSTEPASTGSVLAGTFAAGSAAEV